MTTLRRRAFSLLEVIVAIGILGVSLTALFASESAAVRASVRAQRVHFATLLARCKMGEIEEKVLKEGLPAASAHGRDECCDGADIDGFRCEWNIETVVLPTTMADEEQGSGPRRGDDGTDNASLAMGRVGTAADFLAGGGNRGGLEAAVLGLAIPVLNPAIEAQVRRVDVEVLWNEGAAEKSFSVSQFLVNEQQPNTEVQNPAARGGR